MAQTATILVGSAPAAELQMEAFARRVQAHEKVLWVEGSARASVLHLSPGSTLEPHKHRSDVHHIWVVNGSCVIEGHQVQTGSYLFVPAGVEHRAKAGMQGCILFYLVLPGSHEGGVSDGSA